MMTPTQIQKLRATFPNAPESFFQRQIKDAQNEGSKNNHPRLRPANAKPAERVPLDGVDESKEANWHDAAGRFEITFIVFALRPCDWDGWDIKALQDFLVTAGIIPDDRWNLVSGRVVSRKVSTELEEKTEIEIVHLTNN